ncbi:peptidyl-prolyl cis-trans isomerase [Bradyrhizobium sp. MOS003]|uniref:peptidyl-prolyl cis-trans isomerase n=1 Tax=Bradyrhizobium sp. MOS003 TaxID=2133946 RepID=UPI0013149EEA|nr:peptidyl-prolyl cis-trans isomerase [Bradyrhizobium sp. MOS003]
MTKRLLSEPLLHFVLIGAALFAAHGVLTRGAATVPGRIAVTQDQIESMALLFSRTWQRMPSDAELQGLIRSHVREEVLYREGLAMGLERDDPIIRRRIAQKLEFVAESGDAAEPSDGQLQDYLDSHLAAFAGEPRITFSQIYLDPKRHKAPSVDAERMLDELNSLGGSLDPEGLGDPTTLPLRFDNITESGLKNSLGEPFVKALAQISPGQWKGPIKSDYGMHLVRVLERTERRSPALADVRESVKRDWERTRRMEASAGWYQNLLQHYTVTIERPRLAGNVRDDRPKWQE